MTDSTTRDPKLEVLMLDYGRAYTEANRVIPPDNIALSQLARAAKAVFAYVSGVRVPESASVHYRAESASVQEAAEAAARELTDADGVDVPVEPGSDAEISRGYCCCHGHTRVGHTGGYP